MQVTYKVFICLLLFLCPSPGSAAGQSQSYGRLSQRLLEQVKYQEPTEHELAALLAADPEVLCRELDTDRKKLAFWLNIYNSLAGIALRHYPELYADRKAFFSRASFTIAGSTMSLDDIENGMLRRAKPGFLPRFLRPFFMSAFMRRLSVAELDPRIHFALNCNARSCPPILFYASDRIDSQLDAAALNYLKTSVAYDPAANRLELPEIFSWYADDFGGEQGITGLVQKYGIIGQAVRPVFIYTPWDWAPEPGKFE